MSGRENWVWALLILWGQGECWTCVCVLVAVVCGGRWGVGRGLGQGPGAVGWCYVCVRCESGFSVLKAYNICVCFVHQY